MKTLLTILICSFVLTIYAKSPEKKIKKVKDDYFTNIYTVNKRTKQWDGEYFKMKLNSSDTLVFGHYDGKRKTGIWKYKGAGKKDYISYNYDNHKIEYLSPSISSKDSFYIKSESNGIYFLSPVNFPPVYLGFKGEVKSLLTHNIKVPLEEMQNRLNGTSAASFVIDKTGKIGEIKIERRLSKSFDSGVLKAINMIDGDWIPARIGTESVDSKMYVLIHVSNSLITSKMEDKSYQYSLELHYFGVQTRTVIRSEIISVPMGSSPYSF